MVNLPLKSGLLKRTILIPGSKSYANRILILAALKEEAFTVHHLPEATDVKFLISSLKEIGLDIEETNTTVKIKNSFPACESTGATIDVGDGGTTARFLACMLLKGKMPYHLILGGRLKDRPWDEFISWVNTHGGQANLQENILSLQGPVTFPDTMEIDCQRTTQFASGLQLTIAFDQKKVIPINLDSSQSYWKMTEKMIADIRSTHDFSVPLDWSSASYPLAFAALNQEINFPDLHPDTFQSDSKFIGVLKDLGCVTEDKSGIKISKIKSPKDITLDMSDCLDLSPTMGYFLSYLPGSHKLLGIKNLVHKESDRLAEILKLLATFSIPSHTDGETLFIEGVQPKVSDSQDLVLPHDHRMVMSAALFLLHNGGGSVSPAEAVDKSYPSFFQIIDSGASLHG